MDTCPVPPPPPARPTLSLFRPHTHLPPPHISPPPCLQAAHIGCGISGREGRAAVLASDFSFAQFRCERGGAGGGKGLHVRA